MLLRYEVLESTDTMVTEQARHPAGWLVRTTLRGADGEQVSVHVLFVPDEGGARGYEPLRRT